MSMLGFGPIAEAAIASELTAATVTAMTAAIGSFALNGQATLFQYQQVSSLGSFALTGEPAVLTPATTASQGSFTLTGEAVLFQNQQLTGLGNFALVGENAALTPTIAVELGSFQLSGTLTNLENLFSPGSRITGGNWSKNKWHALKREMAAQQEAKGRAVRLKAERAARSARKKAEAAARERQQRRNAAASAGELELRRMQALHAMQAARSMHNFAPLALHQIAMRGMASAQHDAEDEEALALLGSITED